jgi:hypothetical protein
MPTRRLLVVLSVLAVAGGAVHLAPAQEVTIYRCVDAKGHLTLRDTPCAKNEKQETRTMQRPRDAKPAPTPAPTASREPDIDLAPQREVVYAAPPRPLYECITPDDETYTSDTGDGNPRWVPNWTLGYPVFPLIPGHVAGANLNFSNRNVSISAGSRIITPTYIGAGNYGGQWIRDVCYELPQADVCDRVRDRRDELRRRFFNAQPSERDVLRVEERSINARLDADCGGR